jgi:lipopolysaccharide/colanic/teichoic acid biosynthesis glycosyltransferase
MPALSVPTADIDPQIAELPNTRFESTIKRTIDLAGAALLLFLSAPFVGVLALLIKLQDGGPAFYRRRAIGREPDGRKGEFDAFKLRTMRVDAEEELRRNPELRREFEINFKLKDDPRVTPLGRFLRRSSLDELPQLWNVLRGEMSLVGPRMISPQEAEKYGDAAWIFRRVRPGLTGYWQVNGDQKKTYEERVAMDLYYVKNWSLVFDLKILLLTPWRVLRGAMVEQNSKTPF